MNSPDGRDMVLRSGATASKMEKSQQRFSIFLAPASFRITSEVKPVHFIIKANFLPGNGIDNSVRSLRHARPHTPSKSVKLYGKFRIVASHHAPLHRNSRVAIPLSLNLPAGFHPLGSPSKGFTLCTPEPTQ